MLHPALEPIKELFLRGDLDAADKQIRKWLEERIQWMDQYANTNFCKEFLRKHLGLDERWCEHIKRPDLLPAINWKFCPDCGAPRP